MKKLVTYFSGAAIAALLALSATGATAESIPTSGTFVGANKHVTTGNVSIVRTAKGGAVVILDNNFSLDGAPDPRVGLGRNGKYNSAADLGKLTKINGLQAYTVPVGVDVSKFNEVYIWCRKFGVSLGVASLE